MKMQGLTLTSLKKHTPLIPLFLCIAAGGSWALFYTLRLAIRNPDVAWTNKKEAEPWDYYKNKQYKFYTTKDSTMKSSAPEY